MLQDGLPYEDIIATLRQDGHDLSKVNLHNWKVGGCQDWLREQSLLHQAQSRYELALDLARQSTGIESFQAAQKLAASLICQTIAELGAQTLRQACASNPLNILRMLNALSRLTTGGAANFPAPYSITPGGWPAVQVWRRMFQGDARLLEDRPLFREAPLQWGHVTEGLVEPRGARPLTKS